jgi:hypothetical protein
MSDRNHGVLLSGITLVIEMCQQAEECLAEFRSVRFRSSLCIELLSYSLSDATTPHPTFKESRDNRI